MRQTNRKPDNWMFESGYTAPGDQSTERLPALPQQRSVQRRQRRGMKLVIWLMALTLIAIVVVIGAMLASETIVKPMVADRVEAELGQGVETFVAQELAALPVPVDAPQQYLVSEGELNQRIAEQPNLGPLDKATAEIHEEGIVVHLSAYRMSGTYRAQVVEANGAVSIENGSLSGPLSYIIPVEDLERAANEAILGSLVTSSLRVTDVTLVEGEIVLTLEPTGA